MGFFDAFRKKRISTPDELVERIQEIEKEMDEEEQKLLQDIERRVKSRFDRFWRFEEPFVRSQLTRIEDLFHLGAEVPAAKDGSGEPPPAEDSSSGEAEAPVSPPSPLSADDMKWVKTILWQVWRRSEGACYQCRGEAELHFLPGAEEIPAEEEEESPLPLTPETAEAGATSPESAEGGEGESAEPQPPPEPPIDESVTRTIISRLRLACIHCATPTGSRSRA